MSPSPLLDQVRAAIRVRHYSPRTEKAYVHWIRRYILFNGKRHPRGMDAAEVRDFLNHLWPAPGVRNICRWCCRAVRSPVCWRAWKARSS